MITLSRLRFAFFFALLLLQVGWVTHSSAAISEPAYETARSRVKQRFIGLDFLVDQFMDQIKSWALFPETRIRPLVVFLAGPTSTGKTALVNAVIEELSLEPGFLYFDMDRYTSSNQTYSSFGSDLGYGLGQQHSGGSVEFKVPENFVLMFDEMQKVNTKYGPDLVERPSISQVWEILGNDGQLSVQNPEVRRLFGKFSDNTSQIEYFEQTQDELSEPQKKEWAKAIKENEVIAASLKTIPKNVRLDLSGSLIIIAANLDHVYAGSGIFDTETLTADQLHQLTASVKLADLRKGLGFLFRPEHVGRFGSRLISVPTLPEIAFRRLIEMRLGEIATLALEKFRIQLIFSDEFKKRIYDEGVTPSQGPRPLQTAIANFAMDPLGSLYSKVIASSYTSEKPAVVTVDVGKKSEKSTWTFTNGALLGQSLEFSIPSDYINSRKLSPEPKRSITAVRLAGRVTVYAKLKKSLPRIVRANSRSSDRNGYIDFPVALSVTDNLTRSELIDLIAVRLSSYAAEELVFGEPTLASIEDLANVARYLTSMVNHAGLGNSLIQHSDSTTRASHHLEADYEQILSHAKSKAKQMLIEESPFFALLAKTLTLKPELTRTHIARLLKTNWSNQEQAALIVANQEPTSGCKDLLAKFVVNSGAVKAVEVPITPRTGRIGFTGPSSEQ